MRRPLAAARPDREPPEYEGPFDEIPGMKFSTGRRGNGGGTKAWTQPKKTDQFREYERLRKAKYRQSLRDAKRMKGVHLPQKEAKGLDPGP